MHSASRLDRSDAPLLLLLALIDTAPEYVRPTNSAGAGANARFNAGSLDAERSDLEDPKKYLGDVLVAIVTGLIQVHSKYTSRPRARARGHR